MKHRSKVLFIILFSGAITFTYAQENTLSAGAKATGNNGTVTYSVGQLSYQSISGSNGSLIEGVQQPYEISTVTSIEGANGVELFVKGYPNPARDYFTLRAEDVDLTSLTFQLFDINGKIIQNGKITETYTKITVSYLTPSIYFLKVQKMNRIIKTFKITKL